MNFIKSLSDEDRRQLLDKAERKHFEPGRAILEEGDRRPVLFVLHSGEARVERSHGEFQVEISRLKAGEIFGEMSFVEGFDASASIVADKPCVVDIIDVKHVKMLIAVDPGFYGRFYQSLANTLSQRLREVTVDSVADYSWGGQNFTDAASGEDQPEQRGWSGGDPLRDSPR